MSASAVRRGVTVSGSFRADPSRKVCIDRFPVTDPQDQDFFLAQLVDHPVIADAEFPIAFQRFSKGCAILVWGLRETRLNRAGDPTVEVARDLWNIFVPDSGVIAEGVRHSGPRSFW